AAAIEAFVSSHKLAGVKATGPTTVVFHLTRAASDFNNIMSLPFSSPAPAEYLSRVPDSADFRSHTISDGPYAIQTYRPNNQIVLVRNPAWKAATDHVRKAYVDEIKITEGQTSQAVQQQLQAGTADMEWDSNVPPQSLPALQDRQSPNLDIYESGSLDPYMVFNFQSPNAGQNQVITPGSAGYAPFDPYPSAGGRGNAAKARQLLAKAGASGVTLKLM